MMDIFFRGEDGRIEGKYYQSNNVYAPAVLILSPDPTKGGTMQNKLVSEIFQVFVENGFSALKINYRGVGRSDGHFTGGQGELEDATLAINWLQRRNMNTNNFWTVGFSFGSWITAQLLMRRPEINGYILVSPPTKEFSFNFLTPCNAMGLILQADGDHLSDEEDVIGIIDRLSVGRRGHKVDYHIVDNANHYFTDADSIKNLREQVTRYLQENIDNTAVSNSGAIKKTRRRRKTTKLSNSANEIPSYLNPIKSITFE